MYKPWACRKCGAPMYGPNDHETTAGCAVAWPPTITTGDTSGYVPSGPIIWGSEEARRLSRYEEAVRLLLECVAWSGKSDVPGLDWIDLQVDRDSFAEAVAFLASEPKREWGGR